MITLTEAAQEQIDNLCKDNNCYGVSLNLKGGGCAGFEYVWELVESDEDVEDRDEVIKTGAGYPLIISSYSVMYLIGSTIDYKKDIMGSMFDIQNPNAQSACGCGVSVNFNDMF
jgi:iron-sulfur cluster assembly protein